MLVIDKERSKEQFVHQVFESIADDYDRMNSILSLRRHKAWRKFTMKKMGVKKGDTVLDVCCGTCDWTIALSQASETGRVVGLDFSQKMLEVGRKKVDRLGLSQRIELVHGNAMNLPYPDHTFDHVTIGFALRNVPDFVQVLREMKRVAKPGGQVVSLELSKPTWPIFRTVYYLYFERILPLLGKWLVNRYQQYQWLPKSLEDFPDYRQLSQMMLEEIGFAKVKVYPLTGGITALHIARKGDE